jgi:hypothetical protein
MWPGNAEEDILPPLRLPPFVDGHTARVAAYFL